MPRAAFTLETAQQRLDERFPDSGVRLVSITKAKGPCEIHCPIHGVQRVPKLENLLHAAKYPCPKCGRKMAAKKVSTAAFHVHSYTDAVQQLLDIVQQPLSDAEFGAKVRQLFAAKE